jgi:hypothetical protein
MSIGEKFLTPKELVASIKEHHGITVSRQFICAMIKAGVTPRLGFNVRLSDLTTWWLANPDFSPRARRRAPARNRR